MSLVVAHVDVNAITCVAVCLSGSARMHICMSVGQVPVFKMYVIVLKNAECSSVCVHGSNKLYNI